MLLRNIIMAIILALFYLSFMKGLAKIADTLPDERKAIVLSTIVIKYIFFGIVLNVLLTLLGLTEFCFADCFICTSLLIFLQTL